MGEWIIWSIEHNAFWAPQHRGYVQKIEDAGKYTFNEALRICKGGNVSEREDGYPDKFPIHEVMCPSPDMIKAMIEGKNECPICEGVGKIKWKFDPKEPDKCPGCNGKGVC